MKKGGFYIFLISLLLAILICVSFYFLYYKKKNDEIDRLKAKVTEITKDITEQERAIENTKRAIADMKIPTVNLNYFNRNNIEGEDKIAFFLKVLNNRANSLGISFLSISPKISQEKNSYIKESFEINIKTDFNKLIIFLDQLQNSIGINIDRLIIRTDERSKMLETTAVIELNSIEMQNPKDKEASTLKELRRMHFEQETAFHDMEMSDDIDTEDIKNARASILQGVHRDPFKKPENIEKFQEKLIEMQKELTESKLLGIIEFEGERHAIIGRHTVKKKDSIFGLEVLEITSDTVTLGDRGLKFTYQLKKNEK